jgi:trimethylamine---corrinoid protein Co-methyltransferase
VIRPVHWKGRRELLEPAQVESLHWTALSILERTGLAIRLSAERQQQLQAAGLLVEDGRVRFPPDRVEEALRRIPEDGYRLCAVDAANDLHLDGRQGYLSLDGCAARLVDPRTGEVRASRKADLEEAVRVADGLDEISLLWPCVSATDLPARVQPLHELEVLLRLGHKHAQAMTVVDPGCAAAAVAMAVEVAGSPEKLRRRPIVSTFQCSVSPLCYEADALEAALIFAEAGLPVGFWSMTIGGGTAPITPAGSAALVHAEVLGGVTLLELLCPGAPTFYGTSATMMELRRGGVACGGPEDCWLQAVGCQLAHRCGLPASIGTFASAAKESGWQAGAENALSGLSSLLAGADLMPGAGLLHSAALFSFDQLLLDCELFDATRVLVEGFAVDADGLAAATIESVGPRGHFLAEPHTLAHLRRVWQPRHLDRASYEDWAERGRPTPAGTAHARVLRLLDEPPAPPPPWAEAVAARLREAEEKLLAGVE